MASTQQHQQQQATATGSQAVGASSQQAVSATNKQPAAQQQAKISSANLLSPNAALEHQVPSGAGSNGQQQQRRRSTLSANGFFIDYSCTRRRSSARPPPDNARDPIQAAIARNQFLRNVISPVRRPSTMVAGSLSAGRESFSAAGSPAGTGRARSRSSYTGLLSVGSASSARMAAGSRKTSIFDPTGHSLAAAATRRKSTMVTGGAGAGLSLGESAVQMAPGIEQAATMLAVSRQAAAVQRTAARGAVKSELVQRVPVIGCSPTSIRASLAALEETRRYEKLLRKLNRHQKRKQKERAAKNKSAGGQSALLLAHLGGESDADDLSEPEDSLCDIDLLNDGEHDDDDDALMSFSDDNNNQDNKSTHSDSSDNRARGRERRARMSLRRKSVRALKEAASLLDPKRVTNREDGDHEEAAIRRRHRRHRRFSRWTGARQPPVDGLSISSTLSFASSQTSLPSMSRFLDDISLYEERDFESSESSGASRSDDRSKRPCDGAAAAASRAGFFSDVHESANSDSADEQPQRRRYGQRASKNINGLIVGASDDDDQSDYGLEGADNGNDTAPTTRRGQPNDNNIINNGDKSRSAIRQQQRQQQSNKLKRSLVRETMRKIAAKLGGSNQQAEAAAVAGSNEQTCSTHEGSRPLDERRLSSRRRRKSSVAAAARHSTDRRRMNSSALSSLNYRHYYYYLRHNSLDASDELALVQGPGGEPSASAAVGASGTPMSESERRARLYVNYSLARLEILNSNSDPVAKLAAKLAKMSAQEQREQLRQQEAGSGGGGGSQNCTNQEADGWNSSELRSSQTPAWNRLFDFSQSTDVSLTLSTSSTSLDSSSTSRNSSSMSSPVSTVSSMALGMFDRDTTSGTTITSAMHNFDRPRARPERIAVRQHQSQLAPSTCSSANLPSSQSQNSYSAPSSVPFQRTSMASNWPQTPNELMAMSSSTEQQDHNNNNNTHTQIFRRTLQPPASTASHSHSSHSIGAVYADAQSEPTDHHYGGHQSDAYAQPPVWRPNELAQCSLLQHQRQPCEHSKPVTINDPFTWRASAVVRAVQDNGQSQCEPSEDDFDRFSRMNQHGATSPTVSERSVASQRSSIVSRGQPIERPSGDNRRFGRDAHFRFSVKAARERPTSGAHRQATNVTSSGGGGGGASHLNQQTWGPTIAEAAGRRASRTFLSWDRLEMGQYADATTAQGQSQWTPARTEANNQQLATSSSRLHPRTSSPVGGPNTSGSELERRLRDFSLPPNSTGAGRFIIGDHPANRRSFRQPKQQAQQPGNSLSSSGGGGGWRLSYFVSPSRSFLFQRKQSSTKKKQQRDKTDYEGAESARAASSERQIANERNLHLSREQLQQRREADELLGEFEAQMSEAASLAASGLQHNSTASKTSTGVGQEASTSSRAKQRHAAAAGHHQEQVHLACKSRTPSRSSSSSMSSRSFASFQEQAGSGSSNLAYQPQTGNEHLNFDLHQQQQQQSSGTPSQLNWTAGAGGGPQTNQVVCGCGSASCEQTVVSANARQRASSASSTSSVASVAGQRPELAGDPQSQRIASNAPHSLQVPANWTGGGGGGSRNLAPGKTSPTHPAAAAQSGATGQHQHHQTWSMDEQRQRQWALANNAETVNSNKPAAPPASPRSRHNSAEDHDNVPNETSSGQLGAWPQADERLLLTQTAQWFPASVRQNNEQQADRHTTRMGSHSSSSSFYPHQANEPTRARAYSTGTGNEPAAAAACNSGGYSTLAIAGDHQQMQPMRSMETLRQLAHQTADELRMEQNLDYNEAARAELPVRSASSIMNSAAGQAVCQASYQSHQGGSMSEHTSPGRSKATLGQEARHQAQARLDNRDEQQQQQQSGMKNIEPEALNEREIRVQEENETIHLQAINMLRKSSFSCTVLGARQTGKRTIVICFVKLLNEFKLAADEYKKEKMLTKLVECSERLHELTTRQEEQEELQRQQQKLGDEQLDNRKRRTSRLNSWLPGGGRVRSLLNLAPVSKRRLNSMANLWVGQQQQQPNRDPSSGEQHQMVVLWPAESDGNANDNSSGHQQQGQRRHTAIEPPSLEFVEASTYGLSRLSASSRYLNASNQPTATNPLGCSSNNKSDTNINYQTTNGRNDDEPHERPERSGPTPHQLQVPSLDTVSLRKHSEPTNLIRSEQHPILRRDRTSSYTPEANRRQLSQSPGSVFLSSADGGSDSVPPNNSGSNINWQRRHTALPMDVTRRRPSQNRASFNVGSPDDNDNAAHQRRASRIAPRRQSICLSKRSKRILLSLKELNRRKFAIKFSTRRQISETYKEHLPARSATEESNKSSNVRAYRNRRRSILLQLVQTIALPDSFLVVYSISDRDSFEYAESLIKQLRAGQRDVPLPIILVANKSDLERNREVKSEDGRNLARSYACKFIEISCTIGFNLDTLLVGLRTQLVLRHHVILNSILRPGFRYKPACSRSSSERKRATDKGGHSGQQRKGLNENEAGKMSKSANSDNILMRFYKRYVMDTYVHSSYDCDNFSKL